MGLSHSRSRSYEWRRGNNTKLPDLTFLIDSREKKPFTFTGTSEVVGLQTCDYSVKGLENLIGIERKELADLHGCIGFARDRFERELERMRSLPYRAVVVEATLRAMYSQRRADCT